MKKPTPGYLRHPSLAGDRLVFACEDDLWTASATGGEARRLTASAGPVSRPQLSRDGRWLAWTGSEEGHTEVYAGPSEGGDVRRLTWLGGDSVALGWTPDGRSVV
ncbi:MAG: PD40 domain-containing protein, partial [Candidatus Brocadiae bacterium]|nr:PD40 domain-containing protein [Candidatus Brocadiia bacterium]